MLNAIMAMIGYYLVILASAMFLIVIGIHIFKVLTARKRQAEPSEKIGHTRGPSGEIEGEFIAAAIAAVSLLLTAEPTAVSVWRFVERSSHSPWKTASRSRRVSPKGG